MVFLLEPALKGLLEIILDKDHPHRLGAIKEVLERNQLYAIDVEPPHAKVAPSLRVNTQVNTNVAAMSDAELKDYRLLLQELKALMPAEASKAIDVQD